MSYNMYEQLSTIATLGAIHQAMVHLVELFFKIIFKFVNKIAI